MKHFTVIMIAIVVSFTAGWYFGYTRPTTKNQKRIIENYEAVRDLLGYTDAEMTQAAKTFPKPTEVVASFARDGELVTALALASVMQLDRGSPEAAKQRLLDAVGSYYRVHRSNELYTNIIMRIEKAGLESASVAAEISKQPE